MAAHPTVAPDARCKPGAEAWGTPCVPAAAGSYVCWTAITPLPHGRVNRHVHASMKVSECHERQSGFHTSGAPGGCAQHVDKFTQINTVADITCIWLLPATHMPAPSLGQKVKNACSVVLHAFLPLHTK